MNNRNKLFTYGYILGIMSFLIGTLGYIITLILTPTYRMWALSISMLLLEPYGPIARIGLIISNITAIPFVVSLGVTLKTENVNEIIRKIAIVTGIFACVNAILTGAVAGHDPIQSNLHGFFVLLSWIGGAITCFTFSFLMLKNPNFSKFITTSGFIVAGIFIGFLIPFFITNFCSYFPTLCYSFGQMVYIILPTWEWAVVLSILYWYFSNSVYMFYKKDLLAER
ncbi:MAG: hypothetical protein ACFE9S_20810 [Candidatus Hermodarchaeota archaeon]